MSTGPNLVYTGAFGIPWSCRVDLFKIRGEKLFVSVGELTAATLLAGRARRSAPSARMANRFVGNSARRILPARITSSATKSGRWGTRELILAIERSTTSSAVRFSMATCLWRSAGTWGGHGYGGRQGALFSVLGVGLARGRGPHRGDRVDVMLDLSATFFTGFGLFFAASCGATIGWAASAGGIHDRH